MKYLRDRERAAEAIAGLRLNVAQAEYELAAALAVAKSLGLTWAELGEAMEMTKQGASQFAKRQLQVGVAALDDVEVDRVCRVLGAGDAKPRYEVRRIVSGKPGVTRVVRELVSRHRKLSTAESRCLALGDVELWQVDPDGTETALQVRSAERRAAAEAVSYGDDGGW